MAVFTAIGAIAGAVGGAVIGSTLVGGATATIIGGAVGAVVGGIIGNKVDKKFDAAQSAINDANTVGDQIAGITDEVTTLGGTQVGVQKDIIQTKSEQDKLAVRRQRRSAIREAQIVRARQRNMAQAMGAQGSAVSGGAASIGSELSAALGYSTQQSGLSQQITQKSQESADIQGQINALYGKANVLQGQQSLALAQAGLYQSQAMNMWSIASTGFQTASSFMS
tara:strand:+ start:14671 stop:15342 length:672 start_codon:yes stop_codon:yes gene_type:complete